MSGGAVLNIAINLLLTPVVTRLYTKEEFGVFYIYSSIIAIGTLVINFMYPHALVVPRFRKDFLSLLKFCFYSTIIGSCIFGILLFFTKDLFFNLVGSSSLGEIWYLLPIGLSLAATNVILTNWNVRKKEFQRNAVSSIASTSVIKGSNIGFAKLIEANYFGLIVSSLLGDVAKIFVLASQKMKSDFISTTRITTKNMGDVIKEYIKYPTYMLGSNFINRVTADIPLYVIGLYFGGASVGAFGFATAILNIPFNVLGGSISLVYFQKANELYYENLELLKTFTLKLYDRMLILGSLAFGILFAFADHLFYFVFSEEWLVAGEMAMILATFYIFKLISSPFARIFRVVKREDIVFKVNILLAVSRITSIIIGVLSKDVLVAVACFAGGNLVGYSYNNLEVFKVLGISRTKAVQKILVIVPPIFLFFYLLRLIIINFFQLV